MLNPMALVASLYDKWFMKNHNFRRHRVENGVQNHENGMDNNNNNNIQINLHKLFNTFVIISLLIVVVTV